jgi:hypothetical protein
MRLMQTILSAAALALFLAGPTWADTPSPAPEPSATWECPQADGSSIYTNKERAGCRAMLLRPLSVVPSLENMPTIPRAMTAAAPHYEMPPYQDRSPGMGGRNVPDWARDWYANNTSSGSVQAEVCGLYMEWLQLVQKTRGGFFYGSDPSYGGDLTGRNQRGPSYSFYDNARYIALSRMFGTGFVPVGCQ